MKPLEIALDLRKDAPEPEPLYVRSSEVAAPDVSARITEFGENADLVGLDAEFECRIAGEKRCARCSVDGSTVRWTMPSLPRGASSVAYVSLTGDGVRETTQDIKVVCV